MSTAQIVRAWTDEEYRLSLSEEELRSVPTHPAGQIDDELFEPMEAHLAVSPYDTCTCTSHSPRPCCF